MSKVTLEDIHECLIGNKLTGHKGVIDTIDDLVECQQRIEKCQEKTDTKVCAMQNQIHTLIKAHEKRISDEKNKITLTRILKKIASVFISAKTGI